MNNTIWLFSIAMAIEIDALPFLKMGGSFHGELLVITRWYIIYHMLNNQMVYHNQRVTVSNGTLQ